MTIKAWDRAGVYFREDVSNYWEIGVYVGERLKGAGPIYVGRITRERRPRGWRYTVHDRTGTYTAYSRASAINNAHALAIRHPSYRY